LGHISLIGVTSHGEKKLEFKTYSYRSGLIGLAIAGGLAVLVVVLGTLLISVGKLSLQRPVPLLVLGLGVALLLNLVVLALMLYWSIAALRLHYRLDRNGLVIWWGASKFLVPMDLIQNIILGGEIDSPDGQVSNLRAFRGISWADLRAGRARLSDGTPARTFTTSPLIESTVILTPVYAYVVSPRNPDAFIEAWRMRRHMGPTQYWEEEEQRAWILDLPIWRDRLAWSLIALGFLTNLALHAYLAFVFDQLPAMLSFHFDVLGQADRVASRTEIVRLPQVAFLMLVLDLGLGFALYRRHRIATYLVWGGGLVLQLLLWGAVFAIIG